MSFDMMKQENIMNKYYIYPLEDENKNQPFEKFFVYVRAEDASDLRAPHPIGSLDG